MKRMEKIAQHTIDRLATKDQNGWEVIETFKIRAVIKIELRGDDHLQEELKRRSLVLS